MGTSSLRVASADALRGPCRGVNQTRVPLGRHRAEAIAAPPSARLLAQPRNHPRRAHACDRKGRLLRRKPPRGGRFPALLLFGSEGKETHYWKGSAQHQGTGAGSAGGPSPSAAPLPPATTARDPHSARDPLCVPAGVTFPRPSPPGPRGTSLPAPHLPVAAAAPLSRAGTSTPPSQMIWTWKSC
ncbi:PREDICTED: nascent polypeptide-associated complex subunit alpha, muscle-specific form-like [Rhinopithecus bieti]|uniref:nascent polypeptide-associated complex subunit alpha, muscle-specific form-like n=1 Tax=Rhinopithecus bieti TaxID=61621 RepID=UPI00083C498A|nr:PREDICTED: nascent polypeptide-associated complex subunit alpha, muscle-specific form-like [Rhinopithecus bieti]